VLLWEHYSSIRIAPDIPDPLLATDELVEPLGQSGEEPAEPEQPRPNPYAEAKAKREDALNLMGEEIQALSDYLAAKLG
jgi:hypothetical protein